jgi:hypothetical protein
MGLMTLWSLMLVVERAVGASGSSAEPVTSVSSLNVTFHFADAVQQAGVFATGDPWVVGPVVIIHVEPAAAMDGDSCRHGWELNPSSVTQNGLDDRISGYNASLVAKQPLSLQPFDSVLKAVSITSSTSHGVALRVGVILSVLSRAPIDADAFRPPYFGAPAARKAILMKPWAASQLALELLPNHSLPAMPNPKDAPPTAAAFADRFSRPQIDHYCDWIGREMHPTESMPDYGADLARDTGDAAMLLATDLPLAAKRSVAIGYVQYGLDLFAILTQGGCGWPANGGHGNGRKLPLVYTALLLGDTAISSILGGLDRLPCGIPPNACFSEDGELQATPALANVTLFGGNQTSDEAYWKLVMTGDGDRIEADPYRYVDGGFLPGDGYQFCCTSAMWKGTVLPLLLWPEAEKVFNSPALVAYTQRWVTLGAWASPDPCAPLTGICTVGGAACTGTCLDAAGVAAAAAGHPCNSSACCGTPCGAGGVCNVSLAEYGKKFGPDGQGGCIKDAELRDGQGRFPGRHGAGKDGGDYESNFARAMWKAYTHSYADIARRSASILKTDDGSITVDGATDGGPGHLSVVKTHDEVAGSEAFGSPIIELDGEWSFALLPDNSSNDYQSAEAHIEASNFTIRVPGSWDAQGFGNATDRMDHEWLGRAAYRRRVELPAVFTEALARDGARAWLVVQRPKRSVSVYVGSQFLGSHLGYLDNLEVDVTDHIHGSVVFDCTLLVDAGWGNANVPPLGSCPWAGASEAPACKLPAAGPAQAGAPSAEDQLVGSDCSALRDGAPGDWGGFHGHIRLVVRNRVGLSAHASLQIITPGIPPDGQVIVRVSPTNGSRTKLGDGASLAIRAAGSDRVVGRGSAVVSDDGTFRLAARVNTSSLVLWDLQEPRLYTATVVVRDKAGQVLAAVNESFGFRSFSTDGMSFLLNAQPIFLSGYG